MSILGRGFPIQAQLISTGIPLPPRVIDSTAAIDMAGTVAIAVAVVVASTAAIDMGGSVAIADPVAIASTAAIDMGGGVVIADPVVVQSAAAIDMDGAVAIADPVVVASAGAVVITGSGDLDDPVRVSSTAALSLGGTILINVLAARVIASVAVVPLSGRVHVHECGPAYPIPEGHAGASGSVRTRTGAAPASRTSTRPNGTPAPSHEPEECCC